MARKYKFGNLKAADCRGLMIRLPDHVRTHIKMVTGMSASAWLVSIALSTFGGATNEQQNQA